MVLPRGFRFVPSDGDLIYFLNEKVNAGQTTCELLGECDMYGNREPWEIWNDHGGLSVQKGEDLYLFTKLKKVSVNGKRINRRVGSGTWSGANCGELVDGVGEKRHFRYENNGGRDHGAWIMHEYSLLHNNHGDHGDDEYVLCRLRRKMSEAREQKRRKLMNNSNIIIHKEDDQIHLQSHDHDYHHQSDHVQQAVAQVVLEEQTNNGGLMIKNNDNNDPNSDELLDYYLKLDEQEKWSLSLSSSSSSNTGGGAAAYHMNNIIQAEQQNDQQLGYYDNNSNNPIGFDDLIDLGVVFENIDDELTEIMKCDEVRVHKKSSSPSSTGGAEINNNQLILEDQEGGQQDKPTNYYNSNTDYVVQLEDDHQDDEALDHKLVKELEDLLELEIDHGDHDLMEISSEDFQAHMDHHHHQAKMNYNQLLEDEEVQYDKATDKSNTTAAVGEDEDGALDKFAEKLEDILELEIDPDFMEINQANVDHNHHQVEGDQQQHIINEAADRQVLEIEDDNINNIDGMSFAQDLQNIPLYFAPLPPDDQIEDILVDLFNF
ncbi:hypothetical protein FEM48_Zijuj03G0194600 [Ziziphus jujuba var. spinosa]|uniref:NAC domain-containing protein n=1 Tax=Ziziphus jujuba var. spinosa TaxID=714518 RepID=A0A978VS66_ZIZJJ|nr:hypothetical protein FEM48_Zijuj03G0194600 [Ziziphus jujuba var. spinosa]